jgi:cytochrome c oxidase subunit 3
MNTVVSYLLISFFFHQFHGFHVLRCNYKHHYFLQRSCWDVEKRGSYEMVEKVGLYWHFVDLVWVFVLQFSI